MFNRMRTGSFGWGRFWFPGRRDNFIGLVGGSADSPVVKDRESADQWIGGFGLGYLWN